MVGVILRAQGAGRDLDQRWLQQYASDVAVVAIYPRGLRETAPSEEAAEAGDHPHDAEGLQQ
jgi:hypothetical protein